MPGSELSFRVVRAKTRRLWPLMSDPLVCPARTWESALELEGSNRSCGLLSILSYPGIRDCETNFAAYRLKRSSVVRGHRTSRDEILVDHMPGTGLATTRRLHSVYASPACYNAN